MSENINKQEQDYYLTYGFGYVNLKTLSNDILQEIDIFVPREDGVKINILKLKNLAGKKRKLKLIYYIKPVLGEDEASTSGYIKVGKEGNIVTAQNLYTNLFREYVAYISSSENVKSYTGDKEFFVGSKTLREPEGMDKVSLDNRSGLRKTKLCCYGNRDRARELREQRNLFNIWTRK